MPASSLWPLPSSLSALGHVVFVCAGLLVYVLATRVGQQRRHPSAAVAWVVGIAAFPYLGIPLFLVFGTRKFARPAPRGRVPVAAASIPPSPPWATRLLCGLGVPAPVCNRSAAFHADGPAAYQALIELCAGARQQLDVGTFLLGNGRVGTGVAEALVAAASRGVRTRLLLDSVGSLKTSRTLLHQMEGSGVEVRRFMPLLHNPMRGRSNLRNHRKVAISDGRRLWSGGRNLADEYFAAEGAPGAWIDLSFVVDGDVTAQALAQFEQDWRASSGHSPADASPVPAPAKASDAAALSAQAQWIPSGPDRAEDTLHALLMTAAYQARRQIAAVTPYFVPDDALLDAWCTACHRGVEVVLVLPRRSNHRLADWARERALRRLVEAGGRVLLAGPMVHAKAIVIDADLALCGSVNLDSRSLFLNYEAMMAFYGAEEIAWLAQWIDELARQSTPHATRRPGWWRDLGEGIVRAIGFQL